MRFFRSILKLIVISFLLTLPVVCPSFVFVRSYLFRSFRTTMHIWGYWTFLPETAGNLSCKEIYQCSWRFFCWIFEISKILSKVSPIFRCVNFVFYFWCDIYIFYPLNLSQELPSLMNLVPRVGIGERGNQRQMETFAKLLYTF